jgi:ribose-phosphate pyrophosphokinase
MNVVGDVEGKTVVLLDDLIDTAGTLAEASQAVITRGARSVLAAGTHGLFSGPAIERIEKSQISQVIVTDTVPLSPKAAACKKVVQLSVAELLAETIRRIRGRDSLSSLFL